MSYSVVLGDLGPIMPINLAAGGAPFALDAVHSTAVLRYVDPAGATHQVSLVIDDAPTGLLHRTWVSGDLPVVGTYQGLVKVTRDDDVLTYPRTFPNDGQKIIWSVFKTI